MKDTLEKMLAAEREAEEIVKEAEAESRKKLDDARRRAVEVLDKARETAHAEAQKIMNEAVEAAAAEKQQRLDRIRAELESLPERVPDDRKKAAADVIVRTILAEE